MKIIRKYRCVISNQHVNLRGFSYQKTIRQQKHENLQTTSKINTREDKADASIPVHTLSGAKKKTKGL